ncbi:MAG: helix-turn-helix transcriptional regulator [Ruminococcus sp.]|nr:helix-turn-helix transcriptional regulator [Ruminococcus sp.]
MTFGQKIRNCRKELGYTQAELAKRVHTTQPYISRLEKGWFNLSMQMIVKISTTLDISVDYLCSEGYHYKKPYPIQQNTQQSPPNENWKR